MSGNYLQQTTSADDIFRCIFFLALKGLNILSVSFELNAESLTLCLPLMFYRLLITLQTMWNAIRFEKSFHSFSMRGSRGGGGGGGVRTHLKNHKNIGILSNTGPYPLKITKLPSHHSMLGHHRHLNGVSLANRWWPAYSTGIWILSPLTSDPVGSKPSPTRKKTRLTCHTWTPTGKTFWIRAYLVLLKHEKNSAYKKSADHKSIFTRQKFLPMEPGDL